MQERYFQEGDRVKKGQKLASADLELIEKSGFPLHTALLITNFREIKSMEPIYGEVTAGEDIVIKYTKKN